MLPGEIWYLTRCLPSMLIDQVSSVYSSNMRLSLSSLGDPMRFKRKLLKWKLKSSVSCVFGRRATHHCKDSLARCSRFKDQSFGSKDDTEVECKDTQGNIDDRPQ